jgi:3-carboxy-cis,cis-muconate cycloisomerase
MPLHPFDFQINPHVISTPELEALFDEQAMLQRWLDFEAALAAAQARHGVIPVEAAEEIGRRARIEEIDLPGVRTRYGKSRNSVVPLLGELRRACAEPHGQFVHYGATTQDVIDTGQILAMRSMLKIVYRDLRALEGVCLGLAREHRDTPMVARSHGQQALPSTFGLKAMVWATELRRHIERMRRLYTIVNRGQLSGAAGTYAALGPRALEISRDTMQGLGLEHALLSWHTSRDHIGEFASDFALLVMTLAKIANEVVELQKTEIGELVEPSISGAKASSTMPHKRNPVLCQRVVAVSRHVRALAGTVVESMLHEHERDPRSLWAEWLAVPQICVYTGSALHNMLEVLGGLTVRTDRMLANLYLQKDMITSEWLLFQLSASLGKGRASEKIESLMQAAHAHDTSLKQAVLADEELKGLFQAGELVMLDHPEQYCGLAVELTDQALAELAGQRGCDPEQLP